MRSLAPRGRQGNPEDRNFNSPRRALRPVLRSQLQISILNEELLPVRWEAATESDQPTPSATSRGLGHGASNPRSYGLEALFTASASSPAARIHERSYA